VTGFAVFQLGLETLPRSGSRASIIRAAHRAKSNRKECRVQRQAAEIHNPASALFVGDGPTMSKSSESPT
jgi:hypothetical protein